MEIFSSLVFLLLLILVSTKFIYRSKAKPLHPLSLPLLGHMHLIIKKPLHRSLAKLAEQYGPVLSLHYGFRRVLLVSSPSAVEECLTKNDIAFANRPHLIAGEHLGFSYTNVVWSPYGDHWRNLRRVISLEISSYRLQLFSSARKDETRSLLLQLSRDSVGNFHKVEFKALFFKLMVNTLMRMIAGKSYCGENVDLDDAKRFRDIVTESSYLIGVPNISDYLPFLRWFDVQGLEKRMAKLSVDRDSFMQDLIDEHREQKHAEGQEKRTMIAVLLAQQETDPEYYTDQIIRGIIAAMLTAGIETSSVTMEWAMSLLLNHPEVLNKARAEIETRVGQERLLEESDLPSLPYLNNIINETLRLYPTAPVLTHQSSKDCTVGDTHVAGGTMIQMNLWAIHRDPHVWIDPLVFKPERFEVEGEKEGFKWLAFGSGRRRCPGEAFAMRMVGLTIGCLIQCFEWKRVGEELVDMNEGGGNTLPRAKPLVAMCKPRPIIKGIITNS